MCQMATFINVNYVTASRNRKGNDSNFFINNNTIKICISSSIKIAFITSNGGEKFHEAKVATALE